MTVAANYYAAVPAGAYAKQWINQITPGQTHLTLPETNSAITPQAFSTLPLDFYGSGVGYMYGHRELGYHLDCLSVAARRACDYDA